MSTLPIPPNPIQGENISGWIPGVGIPIDQFPDVGFIPESDIWPTIPLRQQMSFSPEWVVGLRWNPSARIWEVELHDDIAHYMDLFGTRFLSEEIQWVARHELQRLERRLKVALRTGPRLIVLGLREQIRELRQFIMGIKEYVGQVQQHLITGRWRSVEYRDNQPARTFPTQENRVDSMGTLQHVDFRREQRIMQIHYRRYMSVFNRTLRQMLAGLRPHFEPVVIDSPPDENFDGENFIPEP